MHAINKHTMIIGTAVALFASACGSDPSVSTPTPAPTIAASAASSTEVEPTVAESTATSQVVEGNESTYATKTFELPFDVAVPSWLPAEPSDEQSNFVTWNASTVERAVRFLIPVNVYPPSGGGTVPPPKDYLTYLLSQTDHGAHFTDVTKTTVGGRPATIVTATVDNSLDGSLGCPNEGMAASDCFGLQPDFILRIAVVDTGDKPLLIWLRNNVGAADNHTNETESFTHMLTSLHFSDRAVQAPAAPIATPLDGTYRWTITSDDALAHGTPGDETPENLATLPWVFTITMNNGTVQLKHHDAQGDQNDGDGRYTVDGDRIVFAWHFAAATETFTYSVDDNGTLHLDPQLPMDSGDQFVMTTNPWEKIA